MVERDLFETATACDLLVTCLLDGDQAMATDVLTDDDTRDVTVALLRWAITGDTRAAQDAGFTPTRGREAFRPVAQPPAADAAAAAGSVASAVMLTGRVGWRGDPGHLRRCPVTAAGGAAFWIDYDYDRENASDGVGRNGAYVRRSSALAESWDGTWDDPQVRQARFAEAAWATATTPVMSPGFVRRHPRVISAAVQYNTWDVTLTGTVQLITPWPRSLAGSRDLAAWPVVAGLASGNAGRPALARARRRRTRRIRVPDGERLAVLPAASLREPAPGAIRSRRLRGGNSPGDGRGAGAGNEHRGRARDRDPGAILMPQRKAGAAALRHKTRTAAASAFVA